jgi:hypothetical protein
VEKAREQDEKTGVVISASEELRDKHEEAMRQDDRVSLEEKHAKSVAWSARQSRSQLWRTRAKKNHAKAKRRRMSGSSR